MKPYYDADGITIYHGDCRDVLPGLGAVNTVVTDPPYGTGWYATDLDVGSWLAATVAKAPTASVFGYPERLVRLCMAAERQPSEWIVWWPTNGAVRGFNLAGARNESEHIAIFGPHQMAEIRVPRSRSARRIYGVDYRHEDGGVGRGLDTHGDPENRRVADVWTDAAPGLGFQSHLRQHPNEKPVSVMCRLIAAVAHPGATVLDPFMGSGTTLRAAKDLGRKAIGIEIEERYCEIAARRMSQSVMDLAAVSS